MASFCGTSPASSLTRDRHPSHLLPFLSRTPKPRFPNSLPLSLPFPSKPSSAISCSSCTHDGLKRARTLREICDGRVPDHVLQRAVEMGYVIPTDIQEQSLPIMLSGRDCILHAQTGSGKTLAYLLLVFSSIDFQRSAVQALIVVPTRELGMQVTKVARMLAARDGVEKMQKACTVMTLLDGGMLKRQKSWLKAEPPEIVVATIGSLCLMLERHVIKLEAMRVLVIDEVDFMFNSSKQVYSLRKLLTSYSTVDGRQTIFASASIPQHNRFLYDCVQQKWTKRDVVHIHVNPVEPMPSHLCHKYMICGKKERLLTLLSLLERHAPKSAIIFVNEQSEKSKKAGQLPSTTLVIEFLRASYSGGLEVLHLEEDMNFNARATSFSEVRQQGFLLVSTDISSRGFDLPQTTHIYNFDLPKSAVDYLHRAGRTGRIPFSKDECSVTTLITQEERFVLQRFENELMFHCEELSFETILCTLEFEIRRPSYYWLLVALGLYQPYVWEYSRLNISNTVMSKRKLNRLVTEKWVDGWDDPRLLTLAGLRRRGVSSTAINSFIRGIGITRSDNSMIRVDRLEYHIREELNRTAPRTMVVLHPLKVVITNLDSQSILDLDAKLWPDAPDDASSCYKVPFTSIVYIERSDFRLKDSKDYYGLAPGKTVLLRYAFPIRCTDVIHGDSSDDITEIRAEYDPAKKTKPKGVLHWVAQPSPGIEPLKVEVRLFERLFLSENPAELEDWLSDLNPYSKEVIPEAYAVPSLGSAVLDNKFQFERLGYFAVDTDSTSEKLVFNRTVTLRDSYSKVGSK